MAAQPVAKLKNDAAEHKEASEHLHITMLPSLPPTKLDLDPEQFPWLTSLGRNLTSLALHQKLDPAIGRKAELEQLIDVLGKRRANNPCLVGESGVGKTAIIEDSLSKLLKAHLKLLLCKTR